MPSFLRKQFSKSAAGYRLTGQGGGQAGSDASAYRRWRRPMRLRTDIRHAGLVPASTEQRNQDLVGRAPRAGPVRYDKRVRSGDRIKGLQPSDYPFESAFGAAKLQRPSTSAVEAHFALQPPSPGIVRGTAPKIRSSVHDSARERVGGPRNKPGTTASLHA